jgi:hypothetical protein
MRRRRQQQDPPDLDENGMSSSYGRRPVIAYHQTRGNNGIVRTTDYRQKIFLVLALTVLYTAFLYRSGQLD